jgi:hypothetical protein
MLLASLSDRTCPPLLQLEVLQAGVPLVAHHTKLCIRNFTVYDTFVSDTPIPCPSVDRAVCYDVGHERSCAYIAALLCIFVICCLCFAIQLFSV